MMTSLLHHHGRLLIGVFHAGLFAVSLTAAFLLRFEFSVPLQEVSHLYAGLWIMLPVKITVFHLARLHRGWWRFVGMADLCRVLVANLVASVVFGVLARLLIGTAFPRSIYIIDFLLCLLATAGARFAVRFYYEAVAIEVSKPGSKGMLIYGAGVAGATVGREIRTTPGLNFKVLGFLDDNREKRKEVLKGVHVLGRGRDAAGIVDRYRRRAQKIDEIIIAMPSATGRQMHEAVANCRAAGVACKTIPGVGDLLQGKVLSAQIRDLSVTDLLGRKTVHLEEGCIRSAIARRCILVTGAAGSIGSGLCRQIAGFEPSRLVLFDQAESDLFRVDLELRNRFPALQVIPQIGDIRDRRRVEEVIHHFRFDSIFHAAAYKHVPMMEHHPIQAVQANVLGTWNLVREATRQGVSNFLMISSDKAVNPANIMGLTKRVAELIVSSMGAGQHEGGTKFVSVRFGNVLGSNGSVVPLFQEQIAAGGPVTVTHPEIRRYFMTTREAVQLVLQAFTMGNGSDIFVLDMGEPVRIVDLARNMIRLSGLEPDEDIEIRYTGLRPGEKLFEELTLEGENILATYHEKIKIFQAPPLDSTRLEVWLLELEALLETRDAPAVVEHLKGLVPEYQPDGIRAELKTAAHPSTPKQAKVADFST